MCLYQVGAVAKLLYTLSILPWLISLYRKGIRNSYKCLGCAVVKVFLILFFCMIHSTTPSTTFGWRRLLAVGSKVLFLRDTGPDLPIGFTGYSL